MKKISEIKAEFDAAGIEQLADLIRLYEEDERQGVKKLCLSAEKKITALEKERERMKTMLTYEEEYRRYGFVCGIDEAGRGPLAGPVVAAAVILPEDKEILYLNDSKKLSAARREELYDVILREAVSVGVGISSPERIDEINILQATYEAMREAVSKLDPRYGNCVVQKHAWPGIQL